MYVHTYGEVGGGRKGPKEEKPEEGGLAFNTSKVPALYKTHTHGYLITVSRRASVDDDDDDEGQRLQRGGIDAGVQQTGKCVTKKRRK